MRTPTSKIVRGSLDRGGRGDGSIDRPPRNLLERRSFDPTHPAPRPLRRSARSVQSPPAPWRSICRLPSGPNLQAGPPRMVWYGSCVCPPHARHASRTSADQRHAPSRPESMSGAAEPSGNHLLHFASHPHASLRRGGLGTRFRAAPSRSVPRQQSAQGEREDLQQPARLRE